MAEWEIAVRGEMVLKTLDLENELMELTLKHVRGEIDRIHHAMLVKHIQRRIHAMRDVFLLLSEC